MLWNSYPELTRSQDNVRLYKVHRDEKTGVQTVNETTVTVLLEGDIETSYTKADNSVVVATDSQKNTVYGEPPRGFLPSSFLPSRK